MHRESFPLFPILPVNLCRLYEPPASGTQYGIGKQGSMTYVVCKSTHFPSEQDIPTQLGRPLVWQVAQRDPTEKKS